MAKKHTWYVRDWINHWERSCPSSRWLKGRQAYQQQRIKEFCLKNGGIIAKVTGYETYELNIQAHPVEPHIAEEVKESYLSDPLLLLDLYQKSISSEAARMYPHSLGFLIPRMQLSCSCHDPLSPCVHAISVVLQAADCFELEPSEYLKFVGIPWSHIVTSFAHRQSAATTTLRDSREGNFGSLPISKPKGSLPSRSGSKTPPFWTSPFPFSAIMDEIYWEVQEEAEGDS